MLLYRSFYANRCLGGGGGGGGLWGDDFWVVTIFTFVFVLQKTITSVQFKNEETKKSNKLLFFHDCCFNFIKIW